MLLKAEPLHKVNYTFLSCTLIFQSKQIKVLPLCSVVHSALVVIAKGA